MPDRTLTIDGVRVPRFLYGTAWKEDETQRLTELALRAGLPRHRHRQPAPPLPRGRGRPGRRGRDRERPGGPRRPVPADQVHLPPRAGPPPALRPRRPHPRPRSSSRSPARSSTWAPRSSTPTCCTARRSGPAWPPADWEAWRAMEAIHDSGRARLLGVSNVTLEQLERLCRAGARPAPLRPEPLLRRPGLGPRRPARSAPRTGSSTRASRC